jgi:hypothetical protein
LYGFPPDLRQTRNRRGASGSDKQVSRADWHRFERVKGVTAMARILAVLGGFCAPLAAHAAGPFTPPEGCQLDMTVQMQNCQLANYYQCPEAPGDRWVSYWDGEGEFFLSRIDAETRWIESVNFDNGEIDRLDQAGSADHAAFSALLAEGRDDYDFVTQNNFGETRRYQGHDQLTGTAVTVDGVALERCSFELTTTDEAGNFVSRRKGMQLVSRKMRLFFSESETFENALGERFQGADAPISFAFDGEEGFGATEPKFGCDMLMTALPRPANQDYAALSKEALK